MSGASGRLQGVVVAACALAPGLGRAAEAVTGVAAASSPPLAFKREPVDPGFPVAGAVLLLLLVGATAAAWWWRHRRAGPWLQRLVAPAPAEVRVVSSVRLDASTRLHVVEWKQRQLLVAVHGTGAPVVLDREDSAAPNQGTAP